MSTALDHSSLSPSLNRGGPRRASKRVANRRTINDGTLLVQLIEGEMGEAWLRRYSCELLAHSKAVFAEVEGMRSSRKARLDRHRDDLCRKRERLKRELLARSRQYSSANERDMITASRFDDLLQEGRSACLLDERRCPTSWVVILLLAAALALSGEVSASLSYGGKQLEGSGDLVSAPACEARTARRLTRMLRRACSRMVT